METTKFKELGKKKVKEPSTSADGVLTRLFRKIIIDRGLAKNLMFLIDKYKREGGERAKSSIVTTILNPEMTWKYFVFLIFEILKVKRMRIKIELEWPTGEISEHSIELTPVSTPKRKKRVVNEFSMENVEKQASEEESKPKNNNAN